MSARIAGWRAVPTTPAPAWDPPAFLAPAVWPRIVTRSQVEQARARLLDEGSRPGSRYSVLLIDLIHCGRCGLPLGFRRRDNGRDIYQCVLDKRRDLPRCGRLAITIRHADDAVRSAISDALRTGVVDRILAAGDPAALFHAAAARARAYASQLTRDHQDGRLATEEWRSRRPAAMRESVHAQRAAQNALGADDLVELVKSGFADTWESASMTRRRAIVRAFISRIDVSPAITRQAPGMRLAITWCPR
jgi:hypothetical protein